jgi:hypothetical protein
MNTHNEVRPICRAIISDLINVNETENGARFRLDHNMGQSTVIGNTYSRINKIESSMLPILRRLRSWDFRTQLKNSSDCSLKVVHNIHYV